MDRNIDISRIQNLIMTKVNKLRQVVKGQVKKEHDIKNLTPNQLLILEMARKKDSYDDEIYHDNWSEYNESYDDYNDCHGDYYDAE
ncbi:MAG: hypothetical protein NC311_04255 [Muribaculaceae bacterium]|nr:hypothetical protein [Muribaculaceae bacterium]